MIAFSNRRRFLATLGLLAGLALAPGVAGAQVTPIRQAIAAAAAGEPALSTFYRGNGYEPIWVDDESGDRARRAALLLAFGEAARHGLPAVRHDPGELRALMSRARAEAERGRAEVAITRAFLDFARAMQTGVLAPRRVVPAIKRDVPERDPLELLRAFERSRPNAFLSGLAPRSQEYVRLFGAKAALERRIAEGGWGGAVAATRIEQGESGPQVVALRDRLAAMGYLGRSATRTFDGDMRRAVEAFQEDHGLAPDGIVGGNTLTELNRGPAERLGQVLVAMERERWLNRDLGQRHVRVNLADFSAKIVVDGETFFETRAVIGKDEADRETPEFSDEIEHMVVNPSWYVPRSITVEEYLPDLRRDPFSHAEFEITDRSGRQVNRARGFAQYTAQNFPFSLRQPPSPQNALGLVKFMFPNRYSIYLHDTPVESLFDNTVRAYSHGCIRLNEPFEFAYALLSFQSGDPRGQFHRILDTGRETQIDLARPIPVHLVYRTAIAKPGGGMGYRRDIYGRDARILAALRAAGVAMPGGAS